MFNSHTPENHAVYENMCWITKATDHSGYVLLNAFPWQLFRETPQISRFYVQYIACLVWLYFFKGLLYFTETLSYKNFVFQHKKQPILFLLIAGPSAIRERAMKNVFLML
jgi:hypothetical protein